MHEVQKVPHSVAPPFPHSEKEGPAISQPKADFSFREKLSAHMLGQRLCHRIGSHPLHDFLWKIYAQEITCQEKAKQEYPLSSQPAGLFRDLPPIHLRMNTDQFGNVTDPLQPDPVVFGSVY